MRRAVIALAAFATVAPAASYAGDPSRFVRLAPHEPTALLGIDVERARSREPAVARVLLEYAFRSEAVDVADGMADVKTARFASAAGPDRYVMVFEGELPDSDSTAPPARMVSRRYRGIDIQHIEVPGEPGPDFEMARFDGLTVSASRGAMPRVIDRARPKKRRGPAAAAVVREVVRSIDADADAWMFIPGRSFGAAGSLGFLCTAQVGARTSVDLCVLFENDEATERFAVAMAPVEEWREVLTPA